MFPWMRRKLSNTSAIPEDLVVQQTIRDLRDGVPEMNSGYAKIANAKNKLDERVNQMVVEGQNGIGDVFKKNRDMVSAWKIAFLQKEIVGLVREYYLDQAQRLFEHVRLHGGQYSQDKELLKKFQREFESNVCSVEPSPAGLVSKLVTMIHEAVDSHSTAQLDNELSRLRMPESEFKDTTKLVNYSALDLFKLQSLRMIYQEEAGGKVAQKADQEPEQGGRELVFVSYSRKDSKWLERLKTHFKPFEREGVIKRWDDTMIKPGEIWKEEIEKAIAASRVVVLLVSPEFLASDFIAKNELPPLLTQAERGGAKVLSVILKPCSFRQTESISKYQAINSPEKPLGSMKGVDRDRVFNSLTEQVVEILRGS